jgi:hypothetical protein
MGQGSVGEGKIGKDFQTRDSGLGTREAGCRADGYLHADTLAHSDIPPSPGSSPHYPITPSPHHPITPSPHHPITPSPHYPIKKSLRPWGLNAKSDNESDSTFCKRTILAALSALALALALRSRSSLFALRSPLSALALRFC